MTPVIISSSDIFIEKGVEYKRIDVNFLTDLIAIVPV